MKEDVRMVPRGVGAELPVRGVHGRGLGPDARRPALAVEGREGLVHDVARREGDEVRWDGHGLRRRVNVAALEVAQHMHLLVLVGDDVLADLLAGVRGSVCRRGGADGGQQHGEHGGYCGAVGRLDARRVLAWEQRAREDRLACTRSDMESAMRPRRTLREEVRVGLHRGLLLVEPLQRDGARRRRVRNLYSVSRNAAILGVRAP